MRSRYEFALAADGRKARWVIEMRIIADIMGGDNAPLETLRGVCQAAGEEYSRDVEFVLVGDEDKIRKTADENLLDIGKFEILHAADTILMTDEPMSVMKEKSESSMAKGLKLLSSGEGDAFVSCGNTGALFTGASLIVRKVRGIQRAAIATVLPFTPPLLLIDSGANVKVNEEYLLQFAAMGTAYMRAIYEVTSPRVGLINNGSEDCKGTELQISAFRRLSESKLINFIGNVEGNMLAFAVCDVAVCDGFTGNIVLKTVEGMGKLFGRELKNIFKANPMTAVASLMVRKQLSDFKKNFDSTEHGGAPILGISKTVIKAHGSSNANAFKNAVKQAINCQRTGVTGILAEEAVKYAEEKKSMSAAQRN